MKYYLWPKLKEVEVESLDEFFVTGIHILVKKDPDGPVEVSTD